MHSEVVQGTMIVLIVTNLKRAQKKTGELKTKLTKKLNKITQMAVKNKNNENGTWYGNRFDNSVVFVLSIVQNTSSEVSLSQLVNPRHLDDKLIPFLLLYIILQLYFYCKHF